MIVQGEVSLPGQRKREKEREKERKEEEIGKGEREEKREAFVERPREGPVRCS